MKHNLKQRINATTTVLITRSSGVVLEPRVIRAYNWITELGYKVKLIIWDRRNDLQGQSLLPGIEIVKIPGDYGKGWRLITSLIKWNLELFRRYLNIKPQIIHACDLDTVLPALVFKWITKAKIVYDIFDWYADTHPVGPLRFFIDRLEKWVVRHVDAVIIAHEARQNQIGLSEKTDMLDKPPIIMTIYNSPDDEELIGYSYKERIINQPYIAYCGLLAPERGIEFLIDAAIKTGIPLVVAGWGPLQQKLKTESQNSKIIHYIGQIPYKDVLAIEANAIAIIALYDPEIPNHRYAAPNKIFESMMLGVPVITNTQTLAAEIVSKDDFGLIIPYGDIASLCNAIKQLATNDELAKRLGANGAKAYKRQYCTEKMRQKIHELYSILVAN